MTIYLKRFWKENLVVFVLLLLTGTAQTIASVLSASALNALVDLDFNGFIIEITKMFAVFMLFLVFLSFQINKISETKQKMATAIRIDVTKRMEQTSYANFHKKQVSTYTSWLSNDLNTIEGSAFNEFYSVLSGIIGTVTSIIALLTFHWSILVLTLAIAGLTLLLPRIYQKKLSEASLFTTKENERFLSKVTDTLNGFDTFFSFNLLTKLTKDTEAASLKLGDAKNKQTRVVAKVAILGAFGNILGQLSIMGLTGFLVFGSLVSVGAIIATRSLASTVFNTVGNLSQQIAGIKATEPIFEKFRNIETEEEKVSKGIHELTSGIGLHHLSYSYGDKVVLSDLTMSFQLGGKYAIVGSSGSGKTTLLNILNGKLTDYQGSAQFSGNELHDLSGRELREHILYMDQIPYLFEGTIGENITLGETYSDEDIQTALKASHLAEVVRNLPAGVDTPIGEAGRLLSGGQRQRVALARGLVRGKKIILLDEGTSSLDEKSALEIEKQLVENKELTVLMITHQLRDSIRARLDDVVVLR